MNPFEWLRIRIASLLLAVVLRLLNASPVSRVWLTRRYGSMNVSEMPILILVFAVTAIIAVITFAYIDAALPRLKGTSNTTVTAFATNFYSGIQLLGVTLIVMAAVSIIGVVMWLRGRTT